MLRTLWMLLAGLMLGFASSPCHAQIHPGDLRMYIDSGFINFDSDRMRAKLPNGDKELDRNNTVTVGPLGVGGIGLAYVVSKYIVPGAYFSLQNTRNRVKTKTGGDSHESDGASQRRWELRPYLEVPFNASSPFVVGAVGGLSLLRQVNSPGDHSRFGAGPIVGLAGHGFVTQKVSLDVSLLFRAAFIKDDDARNAAENGGLRDVKFRDLALLLNVGASYWL